MNLSLRRPAVLLGLVLVVVFVVGLVAILIGLRDNPNESELSGGVDGARNATFEVVGGATSVRVRADSLGDDLYRVTTSDGLTGRIDRDNADVRLGLSGNTGVVDVLLNAGVGWTLRMTGGAQDMRIDMGAGTTDAVQLAGGASRIDLVLARPARPTAVTMTGGVDQFGVRLAAGTPVRVAAASGAGQVTIDGRTHQGVGGGQVFTADGWRDGAAGVDVQASAGAGGITITEG